MTALPTHTYWGSMPTQASDELQNSMGINRDIKCKKGKGTDTISLTQQQLEYIQQWERKLGFDTEDDKVGG